MIGQDRRGHGGQLAFRGVDGLEDLVPELQLDRAPERSQLALRRSGPHEVIERVEQRLLVQSGERMPVAQRVDDVARQAEPLRSPDRAGAEERRDRVVDERLGGAVAADRAARGPEDGEAARLTTNHAEVERAAAEVEHQAGPRCEVGGVRRRDRLRHQADVAESGELGRGPQPPRRALVRSRVPDEPHRAAQCHRIRRDAGQLLRPAPDAREHERDEILETLGVPEDVGRRLERIAEESLERLKEPAGRLRVGVDVRLDGGLLRIGRGDADAEQLELPRQRAARAVVGEVGLDGRPPHQRLALTPHVEHRRHRLAGHGVDGKYPHRRPIVDGERSVGGAEIEAEAHGSAIIG